MNRPSILRHLETQGRMSRRETKVRLSDARSLVAYVAELEAKAATMNVEIKLDAGEVFNELTKDVARTGKCPVCETQLSPTPRPEALESPEGEAATLSVMCAKGDCGLAPAHDGPCMAPPIQAAPMVRRTISG